MKKSQFAVIVATAIAMIAIAVAGFCGGSQPELVTLRVAIAAGGEIMDPQNALATSETAVTSQICDTLIEYDENMNLTPSLALSWKQKDKTTWLFELREGVTFHDGSQFDASAVKYNIERMMDKTRVNGMASPRTVPYIESVTVIDDYTVEIHTKGPVPFIPQIFAEEPCALLSPTACEKFGDKAMITSPVGTGPFKFVDYQPKEYITLEKNADYWKFIPTVDRLTYKIIPEPGSRYLSFLSHDIDVMLDLPPENYQDILNRDNTNVILIPAMRTIWLGINMNKPKTSERIVREGILRAVDTRAIVENLVAPFGTSANVFYPFATQYRLADDTFGPKGLYFFDRDKAKQLLAQAGWKDTNGNGIIDKDGEEFEISLIATHGRYLKDKEIAESIALYLRDVGINCKVDILEYPTFARTITSQKFEMCLLGFGFGVDPEPNSRWLFYSGDIHAGAWSSCNIKRVDELIDLATLEMDTSIRSQYYREMQTLILEGGVLKPIYHTKNICAIYSNITGFVPMPNEVFSLENVIIK